MFLTARQTLEGPSDADRLAAGLLHSPVRIQVHHWSESVEIPEVLFEKQKANASIKEVVVIT